MTITYKSTTEFGLFKDGVCVFKGNTWQCSEYLGYKSKNAVRDYANRGLTCRGYEIEITGRTVTECNYPERYKLSLTRKAKKPKTKEKTKEESLMEYMIFQLNLNGNTTLHKDRNIDYYIEELRKYGLNCTYWISHMYTSPDGVKNPKIRGEQDWGYVIEVKK